MQNYVSVIIPTFNEEKYIENTLKSVRNQDYKGKYEIIVVDSKSKDKTVKIAKKYADRVILVNKKGRPAALNEAAKYANGNIIFFSDADTVILPNALTSFSKVFKDKKVVGATCPLIPSSVNISDFFIYWIFNQFAESSIKLKKPQITNVCVYRKKVFQKVGGFKEHIVPEEDLDLSARIGKHGKIAFVKDTIAITSTRRFEAWGRRKAAAKYIRFYLNYLLARKAGDIKKYRPIR